MTLGDINAMPALDFVEMFGGIYEHSPWVAEGAAPMRPFETVEDLLAKMARVVSSAGDDQKLALLRAHPELAGKAAIDGTLTDASQEEQASAGLDRLTPDEFEELTRLNNTYQDRFEFPFIICVRATNKAGVFDALRTRLDNSPIEEFEAALSEVDDIARLRLEAMIS